MPNTESPKTPEQSHYENITSFAKWAIIFSGSLIVVIASVAIYVSYSDRNAMREEYSKAIAEMKSQIQDLKTDAKEKTQSIKDDAKDAVKSSRDYSEIEISRIKTSTNEIALQETQKQIQGIFATDKIQNLIEDQAVKEVKSKVVAIVKSETKNFNNIDDAASKMRVGHREGMMQLLDYFKNPESSEDSLRAKQLFEKIENDYFKMDSAQMKFYQFPIQSIGVHNNITDLDSNQRRILSSTINQINEEQDLNTISFLIIALAHAMNKPFKPFEIDEVNAWYKRGK
jgi:hypothetical protein